MFAVHRFAQGAADWRSGPRWSIISVLCPVHPFATTWHFPSRGNEKIGGTGYCVTYDTDSQSRNADFISIARRAIRHLQRRRRCRPLSASEHNPPPSGGHHPRGEAPSTFPSEPFEPSEPSHRRCVQGPMNPFSRKDTGIDIIICKMMSIISMCVHYNRQG